MKTLQGQVGTHSRQELKLKQPLADGINAEESAKRGRANASVNFKEGDKIAARRSCESSGWSWSHDESWMVSACATTAIQSV